MLHNSTDHGIDISATRLDDLDREIIAFALAYKGKKVAIDLGSGEGRVSRILALMGFEVWCYDTRDLVESFQPFSNIHFIRQDIRTLTAHDIPQGVVIAISQRTLHHLTYYEAADILRHLNKRMSTEGRLFISVSGSSSKLAQGYSVGSVPLEERYGEVGSLGKETYAINGSVCLYNEVDFGKLLKESGFIGERVWQSTFGNHKAVAYTTHTSSSG